MTRKTDRPKNCFACHSFELFEHNEAVECRSCGTVMFPERRDFQYTADYAGSRAHFDPGVLDCKRRSLKAWIGKTGIPVKGKKVLEVGFGGGALLTQLKAMGADVYGQEVVPENIQHAVELGIERSHLVQDVVELKNQKFDLILYCDSFEHILDPDRHLDIMKKLGQFPPTASAILILPRADCASRRILGNKLWPHNVPDHWIFYSKKGLISLMERAGWKLDRSFYPAKSINTSVAWRHLKLKLSFLPSTPLIPDFDFWLNFGEMGLVFRFDSQANVYLNSVI